MPQTVYWSQTESSKWSLDCLSHDLGHPFSHIVAPVLVCLDINHFVHVARPWSLVEAPTANLIAKAVKSMDTFDLVSKERESGKAGGIEGTRYFGAPPQAAPGSEALRPRRRRKLRNAAPRRPRAETHHTHGHVGCR